MAERLVSTKDYTQGIPPDLKRDALRKIAMHVGDRNADSTFNESCRLLVGIARKGGTRIDWCDSHKSGCARVFIHFHHLGSNKRDRRIYSKGAYKK